MKTPRIEPSREQQMQLPSTPFPAMQFATPAIPPFARPQMPPPPSPFPFPMMNPYAVGLPSQPSLMQIVQNGPQPTVQEMISTAASQQRTDRPSQPITASPIGIAMPSSSQTHPVQMPPAPQPFIAFAVPGIAPSCVHQQKTSDNQQEAKTEVKGDSAQRATCSATPMPTEQRIPPGDIKKEEVDRRTPVVMSAARGPSPGPAPPTVQYPFKDRLYNWLNDHPNSPIHDEDNMEKELQRRIDDTDSLDPPLGATEEIEAEFLPTAAMLERKITDCFLKSRYVSTRQDTTLAHMANWIYKTVMEEHQSLQTDYDADPVPDLPVPKHFYVMSKDGGLHVKKIFLHETMADAWAAHRPSNEHLIIFFDIEGPVPRSGLNSVLDYVVPKSFLDS